MNIVNKAYGFIALRRKKLLVFGGVALAFFSALVTVNYLIIGGYSRYMLGNAAGLNDRAIQGKAIGIVLGGGIQDGKPRPLLKDRLDTAAFLLRSGTVRKLIVSGDNRFQHYDEPAVMREYLITQKSVNPGLIVQDNAGRSTYETCERAKEVFNLNEAVLISESTHLPRAIYLCRSFGIEAYGYSSDGQSSAGLRVGQRFREVMARTQATINIYLIGERTVLGEEIPI